MRIQCSFKTQNSWERKVEADIAVAVIQKWVGNEPKHQESLMGLRKNQVSSMGITAVALSGGVRTLAAGF